MVSDRSFFIFRISKRYNLQMHQKSSYLIKTEPDIRHDIQPNERSFSSRKSRRTLYGGVAKP
jgi:hypothetical protein